MSDDPFDEFVPPEEVEGEIVDEGAGQLVPFGGRTMQRMAGTYATAISVQRPRELAKVELALISEAMLLGEEGYYGWGAGKDRIEGVSQELAHAAARCYGNCAVEAGEVQELGDAWVLTAGFIDLETGFTLVRPFRMSKRWIVHGKHDPERKADIRFQIGASKAARNVILKALPSWLTKKALAAAKEGVRKKIEDYIKRNGLPKAQDMLVSEFAKVGVTEPQILERFEVTTRGALDVDRLVMLRGDLKAIQNGEVRAEELFPKASAKPSDVINGAGKAGPQPEPTSTEPISNATPTPPPDEKAPLAPGTVTRLRAIATRGNVSMEAIEEHFGGSLETRLASDEVEIEAEIRKRSKK